jgi:hypothetical protein
MIESNFPKPKNPETFLNDYKKVYLKMHKESPEEATEYLERILGNIDNHNKGILKNEDYDSFPDKEKDLMYLENSLRELFEEANKNEEVSM